MQLDLRREYHALGLQLWGSGKWAAKKPRKWSISFFSQSFFFLSPQYLPSTSNMVMFCFLHSCICKIVHWMANGLSVLDIRASLNTDWLHDVMVAVIFGEFIILGPRSTLDKKILCTRHWDCTMCCVDTAWSSVHERHSWTWSKVTCPPV